MDYQISDGILSAVLKNSQKIEKEYKTMSLVMGSAAAESIKKSYENIRQGKFIFSRSRDIFKYPVARISHDAVFSNDFLDYENTLDETEKSEVKRVIKDILLVPSKYLLFMGESVLYGKKDTGNHEIIYEIVSDENLVVFHSIIPLKKVYKLW